MLSRYARVARIAAAGLAIAAPAWSCTAQAQAFTLPKGCSQATGAADGDDPVVIVVDISTHRWIDNFTVQQLSGPPQIQWGITISPFIGGINGYSVYTTYTPFLTSDIVVTDSRSYPSYNVVLPQPGYSAGRYTTVYPSFPIVVVDGDKRPIPNAFVDFIPNFVGSSPLTLQADAQGAITLYCVQQNFQGYNITVHDASGKYLFDGSIPGTQANRAANGVRPPVRSRPEPDTQR